EGLAQNPVVVPLAGPRRGLPSGHRGVAPAGPRDTANVSSGTLNTRLFPTITVLPQICLLPFRATGPSTVMASPGFTVSRANLAACRSTTLSSSTAQLTMLLPVP